MNGRAPCNLMTPLALPLAILLPFGIAAKPQLVEVLGPASGLNSPFGVAFDDQGNAFVAEYEGGRILKLDHSGKLRTLSGILSGYTINIS